MFVFTDDLVHFGGSVAVNESFLDSMMGNFVATDDDDLDGRMCGTLNNKMPRAKIPNWINLSPLVCQGRTQFGSTPQK